MDPNYTLFEEDGIFCGRSWVWEEVGVGGGGCER